MSNTIKASNYISLIKRHKTTFILFARQRLRSKQQHFNARPLPSSSGARRRTLDQKVVNAVLSAAAAHHRRICSTRTGQQRRSRTRQTHKDWRQRDARRQHQNFQRGRLQLC
ncbi:hypothetical protein ACQ4LE_007716 [Meloidogyne hapla]